MILDFNHKTQDTRHKTQDVRFWQERKEAES